MPGDFICLKGEVGREMFIVVSGIVEVIVKIDGVDKAVAQMKEGSCFGEISLLSIGAGGNRRTASIVSKGFSKLLVLHKTDFNRILADYPEMQKVLQKSAE
jgi:CRP-like cAMP-binding protein